MAISLQQLTIYLYSAHHAVIFAIAQLSCYHLQTFSSLLGVAGFGEPVTFLAVLRHMSVLQ